MKALLANKKVGRDVTISHLKPVETSRQKKHIPKVLGLGQGKMVAKQKMAMIIDSTGKKAMVASQTVKCSLEVEKQPRDEGESKKEEPDYSPQLEQGEPKYSPHSDEEFDEYMYDETNDDIYGDDFVVNCDIVSVLPVEYDMVSKVSKTEEDFVRDETVGGKPLCYYVMNISVVEEQKATFERPSPG